MAYPNVAPEYVTGPRACNASIPRVRRRSACKRRLAYPLTDILLFFQNWDNVQGFIGFSTAYCIHLVSQLQCDLGVTGAIGEIGVAGGKSFATLAFTRQEDENMLACDLFTSGLEKDNVPDVNLPMFLDVLQDVRIPQDDVTILKQSSLILSDANLVNLGVGRRRFTSRMGGFRLFHVDGGHYTEAAFHDLNSAACSLVPGGVILVDDLHNMGFPGVQEGFHRYMLQQKDKPARRLVPFLFTGRLFLTTAGGYAPAYRKAILRAHPELRTQELYDSEVILAPGHRLAPTVDDFERMLKGQRAYAAGSGQAADEEL